MRQYIRGYFEQSHHILEAANGMKGFDQALQHIPDIVVSDVMMPEMDGYELCNKLKNDQRTSHIPVVLLTAKSSGADKIEGLETGADDFVIKPFEGKELQVRVKNLVDQRRLLREHFREEFTASFLLDTTTLPSMDQQFIEKALLTVERNLDNFEFNVEQFARLMAMSRTQLHRKMKAIADMPAGDFIRTVRLKKAAEMLRSKTGNVAEIAYAVGFNNPSWFAECFKKEFGALPSEYN
jgi:DNA-binding response OmpR family regulator